MSDRASAWGWAIVDTLLLAANILVAVDALVHEKPFIHVLVPGSVAIIIGLCAFHQFKKLVHPSA